MSSKAADERIAELEAENSALRARLEAFDAAAPDEVLLAHQRLTALLDHAPEAIFIKDAAGRYRCAGQSFLQLAHKSRDEVLGRDDHAIFPPDLAARFADEDRQIRESRVPLMFEDDIDYEGQTLHFLTQKFLLPGGEVAGIATNITARKRIDAELRQLALRLTLATEGAGVAVYELNLETGRGAWSASAFEIIGVPVPDDLVGTYELWRSTIHPEDIGYVDKQHAEGMTDGRLQLTYRIIRRDNGEIRWLSAYGRFVRRDGHLISTGVAIDVSEQRLLENERREAEARLRALTDNLPAGMVYQIATGADGVERRFLYVSRSNEKVTGYTAQAFLDDPVLAYTMIVPEHRPAFEKAEARAIATHSPFDIEVRFERADGETRWARIISAPRDSGDGSLVWDGIMIDVSEQKAAEIALREFNALLEERVAQRAAELQTLQEALQQSQKLEAMGQLTGGVAHDFNNLLSPIIGGLDLLQRRKVGDDRAQAIIAGAMAAADRAKLLVQRLLAFARRQPLQPTAVDLGQLVDGMASLLASTVGPRIRVSIHRSSSLPRARADLNQLEMALLNIAVNARDAMPDGGELSIALAGESVGGASTLNLPPGDYVTIAVRDTGLGMDEATLARAVEPFFSTKGIGKGTGLGLSMVHGLAAQLGGQLQIDSRLGFGTTVTLWLPVASENTEAGPQQTDQPAIFSAAGRALLVDDEDLVRASTCAMLRDLGYEVVEASCANDALRLLDGGEEIDTLVTDHLMSGMTGAELAYELRDRLPGLKILVISGYAEVDGIAPDLARLTKPFRLADLAAALQA